MTTQKYAIQDLNENTAKAIGRSLPISTKQSVEICSLLRNKNLQKAKQILSKVIAKKMPVPYKKYNRAMGHKKGKLAVGRYPVNASKNILSILESVEANAQFKGLNTGSLVITHICTHKARNQPRYGRQRGRTMKRSHIEVVVEEKAEKKKETKAEPGTQTTKESDSTQKKVEEKKEAPKVEEKKEQPKAEEEPKEESK
ncbi:50S ribosomal protein L22 [Candidatus Woesearchaeota archaeon]|nr:50S ribosomal protein L22 [Candidatus Woesearchaeota archaeon]